MKELYLIHSLIKDNHLFTDLAFLRPEHFTEHKSLFSKIEGLYQDTQHVDKISLDLADIELPRLEGFIYLKHTAEKTARMMFDEYQRSNALGKLKKLNPQNIDELQVELTLIQDEIRNSYEKNSLDNTVEQLLEPFLASVRDQRESDKPLGLELRTLPTMNNIIGGILPTDYIGIYGKEKSSKSSLALEIMLDLCIDQKIPGAIFSFEMSKDLVLMKTLSMRVGIDINHLRNPSKRFLSDAEFDEYAKEAARKVHNTQLYLIDDLLNEYEIETKCKKLAEQGVKIVLIDYLMLIDSKDRHASIREELNHLSKFFKRMAQRLNIAVMVISQANDTGEREAEAKGLSRDSNYYFYVAELAIGAQIQEGETTYLCNGEGEFVVKNRGIRHGKKGSFFITKFVNNKYGEKSVTEYHHFPESREI